MTFLLIVSRVTKIVGTNRMVQISGATGMACWGIVKILAIGLLSGFCYGW